MRYSLRTLQIGMGAGPPTIALLWFAWWPMLCVLMIVAAIWLWVAGTLALARFLAEIMCSVMR